MDLSRRLVMGSALSLLLINKAEAGRLRFGGHTPQPPAGAFYIRSTETKPLDLSSYMSAINDANDVMISVSGTPGVILAQIWKGKNLAPGDIAPYTRRELADFFTVRSIGASNGATIATINISGYGGAGNTGTLYSSNISVVCDNSGPSAWTMGAKTFAGYGGYPIMTYLAGSPADWTIQSQTTAGQFSIRVDATNVQYRLVLAGPINDAAQPGAPTVAPVAGATKTVVLANATLGTTQAITITFVANQYDCAPWPATDNPASGQAGNQLIRSLRGTVAYGNTYLLEDGVFNITAKMAIGQGWDFSSNPIGAGSGTPNGPYAGNTWDYTPNPTINPNFWTIASRTPWGANVNTIGISLLLTTGRVANPILGLRLTNVGIDGLYFTDLSGAGGGAYTMVLVDHCIQGAVGGINFGGDDTAVGFFYLHNFSYGNTALSGLDCQIVCNRFETNVANLDTCNMLTEPSAGNDTRALYAFNLHIDRQGRDDPVHSDQLSSPAMSSWYNGATGHREGPRIIGNVMWPGTPRLDPTGHQCNSGQFFFLSDHPTGVYTKYKIGGNLMCGQSSHGVTIDKTGNDTWANYNLFMRDYTQTNPQPGFEPTGPQIRFGDPENGSTGNTKANYNIMGAASIWSNNAGSVTGTLFSCQQTWLTTNLVNPLAAGACLDMGDVIRALSFKTGLTQSVGPFWDSTLVDQRRCTYDFTRLAA